MAQAAVDILRPYLEEGGPNEKGEWGMFCPLHDDERRSASVNFDRGVWYCHTCSVGGSIPDLLEKVGSANISPASMSRHPATTKRKASSTPLPSPATVAGWSSALSDNSDGSLDKFIERRGIEVPTLRKYQIGWDRTSRAYTIPIFDKNGELINVRRYQIDPGDERRKIWSVAGHGSPTLYPYDSLGQENILLCEGEWDALLTIQNGFNAITRTGAADAWRSEWSELFKGKTVWIIHDMDEKGQRANKKIANILLRFADEVHVVLLPYALTEKNGKDLTDYWLEGFGDAEFESLLNSSPVWEYDEQVEELVEEAPEEIADIRLIDTFSAEHFGKPKKMRVTVTGRRTNTYGVPKEVALKCTKDAGVQCSACKMNDNGWNGDYVATIPPDDQVILEMVDVPNKEVADAVRRGLKIAKCNRLRTQVLSHYSVEEIYVRPDIDTTRVSYGPGDYTNRKVISVGRHSTMPNSTVELTGCTFPHPKDQVNTFLAYESRQLATSIDNFHLSPADLLELEIFQELTGDPLRKCVEIARELSKHVTHIYGRTEMHVLLDLALHSAVGFEFEGTIQKKGWLDVLIVGDTRTGKSEAASALLDHYRAGEMLSCETVSLAGVLGGLEQHAGKEWVVKWGAIPLNDRRAVVLDEVSGLSTNEIAQLSAIRSSGEAQITKIQAEKTFARTRLIWLANPRGGGSVGELTYGVQTIQPLIGNNEDIARFDLAMSLRSGEVDAARINKDYADFLQFNPFTSELCHKLLIWVWSREPWQVFWQIGAQDLCRQAALELGQRYVGRPPLVQVENMRMKVARVAVAIASRTFNTLDGIQITVEGRHVESAVQMIDRLYSMKSFGYAELSREFIEDRRLAEANRAKLRNYLANTKGLEKFLRGCGGSFRELDLCAILNIDRGLANGITSSLWDMRMVYREGADLRLTDTLQTILRGDS